MTEPNRAPETVAPDAVTPDADAPGTEAPEPEAPETDAVVSWPALPSELAGTQGDETGDPAVDALLLRLSALPSTPVSGHAEAYDALHDELLEALNEDVAHDEA